MSKLNRVAILPITIVSLGIFLRFSWLTHQSLWYDEGISLVISDGESLLDPFQVMWARPGGDKYQPLYYTVLFLWRNLFGSSEYLLRTLSVLTGVGTLVVLFFMVKRIYGEEHACWSTLLMSVSAFCIYFSQEIRPFSLQLFLGCLQLYFFSCILRPKKQRQLKSSIVFGLITAINFFGGILLVVFSLSIAISHFIALPKIKSWFLWWLPVAFLSTPVMLYYLASPAAGDPSGDSTNGLGMPLYKSATFVIHGLLVGSSYGPPLEFLRENSSMRNIFNSYGLPLSIFFVVLIVLATGLISYYWKEIQKGSVGLADKFFIILLVISFVLSAILASVSGINWMPRHSFFVYLPLCIVLPLVTKQPLHEFGNRTKLRTFDVFSNALILLVSLNLFSVSNYFFDEAYWRDDYRSAAHYLAENQQPDEASVLLWGTTRLLDYYGAPQTLSAVGMGRNELRQNLIFRTNQARVVYILVNREFAWTRQHGLEDSTIPELLSEQYTLDSKVEFVNFNIYRFHRQLSERVAGEA